MKKRLLRLLLLALLLLFGVITVNTFLFPSRQIPVEPVEAITVDDGAPAKLSEAIKIQTVSQASKIDTVAFRQIGRYLQQAYPLVDSLLEHQTVNEFSHIFEWRGRNAKLKPVLFTAHLDVVPVEEKSREAWAQPPFSGNIRDGYIWGRGALDDKLSAFGWLETAELLLAEGYQPERTIYFAFGHDEEISGEHGAGEMARYFQRRDIHFAYVLDEGLMVVEKALPGLKAPVAIIGIAEKGYLSLELKVQLSEGGHSSMPPHETAITILGDAIRKLQENPFPMKINGATRALFEHAGPEMSLPYKAIFANLNLTSGLLKRILRNDPASAATLRTTMAPTMIQGGVKENVLPTEASAVVNFRILPGETTASVQEFVRKTIADPRINIAVYNPAFAKEPSPLSATNSFGFQVLHKTIREVIPEAVVAPGLVIGATDGYKYLDVAEDVYRFLPVTVSREDIKGFHGINERLSTENYKQLIRFYRQLILNSCR